MYTVRRLSLADAQHALAAAQASADQIGVKVCMAVVDDSGRALAFARMDGAGFIAAGIALNKAITAAGTHRPTEEMAPATAPGAAGFGLQQQHGGRFTTVAGGLPLRCGDEVIGAIGISGASAAQDGSVAQAAATALAVHLQP